MDSDSLMPCGDIWFSTSVCLLFQLQEVTQLIQRKLWGKKECASFKQPVDIVKYNIPDYFKARSPVHLCLLLSPSYVCTLAWAVHQAPNGPGHGQGETGPPRVRDPHGGVRGRAPRVAQLRDLQPARQPGAHLRGRSERDLGEGVGRVENRGAVARAHVPERPLGAAGRESGSAGRGYR
jgi:hypothetical protein